MTAEHSLLTSDDVGRNSDLSEYESTRLRCEECCGQYPEHDEVWLILISVSLQQASVVSGLTVMMGGHWTHSGLNMLMAD